MATKKALGKYQGIDSSQVKTTPKDPIIMNKGYNRMTKTSIPNPPPGWKPGKKKGGSVKSKSKKK